VARQKARAESTKKFYESLAKNSLLLGEGSIGEIKKRQRDETKPGQTSKTGTTPDLSGLNEGSKREGEILARFKAVQAEQIEAEKLKLEAYRMSRAEFEKLTEAKKIDIDATKATVGMSAEGRAAYLAAAEAVKEQRLALIDLQQTQRETWSVGAIGALNEYVDGVKDVASQTKKLFADAFKGMEDSLVDFVKTGKLSFSDLANSIIEDLIRIAIRKGITGPIADGLGSAFGGGGGVGFSFSGATASAFANGGIMTARGSLPLKTYASGGIANSPQVAVFGEGRTPEAYVPLPDGRSIPVSMKGGAGGDVFNISVTVQDGGQPQATGNSQKGGELGKVIANIVQTEIINQKRAGGLLA
jgi:lambda family phage tail tape measure protein